MTSATALIRENPGLLAMVALFAIGAIVFGSLGVGMSRSGVSLRPIVFVGMIGLKQGIIMAEIYAAVIFMSLLTTIFTPIVLRGWLLNN